MQKWIKDNVETGEKGAFGGGGGLQAEGLEDEAEHEKRADLEAAPILFVSEAEADAAAEEDGQDGGGEGEAEGEIEERRDFGEGAFGD